MKYVAFDNEKKIVAESDDLKTVLNLVGVKSHEISGVNGSILMTSKDVTIVNYATGRCSRHAAGIWQRCLQSIKREHAMLPYYNGYMLNGVNYTLILSDSDTPYYPIGKEIPTLPVKISTTQLNKMFTINAPIAELDESYFVTAVEGGQPGCPKSYEYYDDAPKEAKDEN